MAWFGGFTVVQAHLRSGSKVFPIVKRDEDKKFRLVFITADPVEKTLADLKGKYLSSGSRNSASGQLMPHRLLIQQGLKPEKAFRRVAYGGAQDTTSIAMNSDKVAARVPEFSVRQKLLDEKKLDSAQVRVILTTPAYFDHIWSGCADLPLRRARSTWPPSWPSNPHAGGRRHP